MHNKIQILFTGQHLEKEIANTIPLNIVVDELPFIVTQHTTDTNILDQLNNLIQHKEFVVFTSQIAVDWVTKNSTVIPKWDIACMEGQTQKALIDLGWGALISHTANNGTELAKKIASSVPKSTIINFIGSNQRLANLPNYLNNQGFSVKELVAYTTTAKYQDIDKQYDALIFLSPSAVNSFFDFYSISENVKIFSIGQTTAEAVHNRTKNETIVSDGVSQKDLFNKIINYYQNICH